MSLFFSGCSEANNENLTQDELRTLAMSAMKSEDFKKAEETLRLMIAKDENYFDAVSQLIFVKVIQGKFSELPQDFEMAMSIDKDKGEQLKAYVLNRLVWDARGLEIDKKHTQAIKMYDLLLSFYPESGMLYHDRGGTKLAIGDYDGAINDLTNAVTFDEGNNTYGDSYALRGRAKRALGDIAGAKSDDEKSQQKSLR